MLVFKIILGYIFLRIIEGMLVREFYNMKKDE